MCVHSHTHGLTCNHISITYHRYRGQKTIFGSHVSPSTSNSSLFISNHTSLYPQLHVLFFKNLITHQLQFVLLIYFWVWGHLLDVCRISECGVFRHKQYIYGILLLFKAQGPFWKKGQNGCKSQRSEKIQEKVSCGHNNLCTHEK